MLTGVLIDSPMKLINAILPEPSVETKVKALKEAAAIGFENGLTTVDAEESKIVDYIFKKYLSLTKRGLTPIKRMRRLRTLLVRNGYSYRGKEFTTHNINYILRNSFYFGEMKYGDKVYKHNYETIISKRLFNLLNN